MEHYDVRLFSDLYYRLDASMCVQRRSQRGDMGKCPPVMDWKNFLAPELQTHDCFATGVTRQTLLKPKENV